MFRPNRSSLRGNTFEKSKTYPTFITVWTVSQPAAGIYGGSLYEVIVTAPVSGGCMHYAVQACWLLVVMTVISAVGRTHIALGHRRFATAAAAAAAAAAARHGRPTAKSRFTFHCRPT